MILVLLVYLGGVLTILSPCILPVLPFVFARSEQKFLSSGLPMLIGMAVTFAGIATLAAVGGRLGGSRQPIWPRTCDGAAGGICRHLAVAASGGLDGASFRCAGKSVAAAERGRRGEGRLGRLAAARRRDRIFMGALRGSRFWVLSSPVPRSPGRMPTPRHCCSHTRRARRPLWRSRSSRAGGCLPP